MPGPGSRKNGPFSGEEYLDRHVIPGYKAARDGGKVLILDMDGTVGFGPSFARTVVLGLLRRTHDHDLRQHVDIQLTDDPIMAESIIDWIEKEKGK